jgi:hypothetical protein
VEYRLIRQIPTNRGRSVFVGEAESGRRVLVKQAHTAEWATDLRAQTRHFLVMNELLGGGTVYPAVLQHDDRMLVLPYYEHGSLDELSFGDQAELVRRLTAAAVHEVFRIAALCPSGFDLAEATRAGAAFVLDQAVKRVARLDEALATAAGREWAAQPYDDRRSRADAVAEAVGWIRDGTLAAAAPRLGPPRLGLASHGDFGLNNVMLAEEPAAGSGLVFIDTRGLWLAGWPCWDPVLDLATLIAFHCRIEPRLAAAGELPGEARDAAARLPEPTVRALAAADGAVQAWTATDPGWADRLEVEIFIRLLGNVSVQLLTAPRNAGQRAAAVLDLAVEAGRQVEGMLRGDR